MGKQLVIGTRGSDLALWQANFIKDKLDGIGVESELKIIKTQGDKIQDLSFDKMEGKGFFTKEIEEALLDKKIDLAVHSYKDLETKQPKGLAIGAVSYREDPADLLIINKDAVDQRSKWSIKKGAVVGTSSARRKNQFAAFRPDVTLKDLRGNVPTRIDKLRSGDYDGILLAAAGVERLAIDLGAFRVERLDPKEFIPAPAQGVLGLQVRSDDEDLLKILDQLNDKDVAKVVHAEREILRQLEGGCQLPFGAYCEFDEEEDDYKIWTVKSNEWDVLPQRMYAASRNAEKLPEIILRRYENIKPCSVYISRTLQDKSYFKRVLEAHGFEVHGQALIEMKQVAFEQPEPTDWIFFSSPNAVKFYFSQDPDIGNAKLAAISKGTADALRRAGKRAAFIGGSADTKMVGKQFAATASGKVLFPRAKVSMRSVQQCLPEDRVIDRVVYYTVNHQDYQVPKTDLLLFTSPSNVEAYFRSNRLPSGSRVIAMGNATANALKRHEVFDPAKPVGFDEASLAECVFGVTAK